MTAFLLLPVSSLAGIGVSIIVAVLLLTAWGSVIAAWWDSVTR